MSRLPVHRENHNVERIGWLGAKAGGADIATATLRVTFWGALAMAATAGIGKLFGAAM